MWLIVVKSRIKATQFSRLIAIYPENYHFLVQWKDFATTFMLRFYDETLKMLPNYNKYLVHGLVSDKQSKSIKGNKNISLFFTPNTYNKDTEWVPTSRECSHLWYLMLISNLCVSC